MDEISISKFKAKCLAVLERVRRTQMPICVTHHGEPMVEIVPRLSIQKRSAWIGSMKGSIEIVGDIISPGDEESEWEALRD